MDCLDSLLIFGLEDEYARARQWVAKELSFDLDYKYHAFEVSAYIEKFGIQLRVISRQLSESWVAF